VKVVARYIDTPPPRAPRKRCVAVIVRVGPSRLLSKRSAFLSKSKSKSARAHPITREIRKEKIRYSMKSPSKNPVSTICTLGDSQLNEGIITILSAHRWGVRHVVGKEGGGGMVFEEKRLTI
jgi:histidyl-tRNA synthetase